MPFHPFEVTIPHIVYACLGGFIVLFGMFSLFLRERLYIGEALWAFLFGVIIGPFGANIFNPRAWGGGSPAVTNEIVLEFTRVVLAIGVFAIGVELPKAYMAKHWKSLFFLLVPVMTWGWFVSAGLIYALIPGLNFLSSLAVAACLTPTDPILAAAVVGGKWADKHVPAHLRHLLAAESGCNDGAAFPFLFISLYLTLDGSTGHAIRDWFLLLWLYQVVVGVVIGSLIGFGFRYLMKFCQRHDLIDRNSYVAQYISLAMLTIGTTTLLGSDDLLAAFACGTAFAWDGFFNKQTEESVFSSVIDLLFNVAAFIFVGAWMPFNTFQDAALTLTVWRLIVIAILVLLLRRLPVMIALYRWIPDIKTWREAVFSGHFGPIGIGAIFISTLASEVLNKSSKTSPQIQLLADSIQPIVGFMVLCSITIHGLSIPSLSLGRRMHSVSRTWSRHAPPDWTNQAQLVDRGADIVINRDRDSAMERGEILADKMALGGVRHVDSEADMKSPPPPPEDDRGSQDTEVGGSLTDVAKDDTPPDGVEMVEEWQEGHRRVIERREGPGEEVDVEVINEEPREPGESRLDHMRHALEHSAESLLGHAVEDHLKAAEHRVHDGVKGAFSSPSRQSTGDDNDDEEAGWASDRSNGDTSPSPPQQAGSSDSERSIDPRKKHKPPKMRSGEPSARRGRARTSIRRGVMSPVQQPVSPGHSRQESWSSSITPGPDDEIIEERGRFAPAGASHGFHHRRISSSPSTWDRRSRPGTGDGSVRNQRIDNIRAQHGTHTREVSPSRSVRFVDGDHGRGSGGYRTRPTSLERPPAALVSGDEQETIRSRISFEVPRIFGGSGGGGGSGGDSGKE